MTTKGKLAAHGFKYQSEAFYKNPTTGYMIYWAGVFGGRIDAAGKLHHDRNGAFRWCWVLANPADKVVQTADTLSEMVALLSPCSGGDCEEDTEEQ